MRAHVCVCPTAPCKSAQITQPETGKVAFFFSQKQLVRSDFRQLLSLPVLYGSRPSLGRWIMYRHQGVPATALSNNPVTLLPPPSFLFIPEESSIRKIGRVVLSTSFSSRTEDLSSYHRTRFPVNTHNTLLLSQTPLAFSLLFFLQSTSC